MENAQQRDSQDICFIPDGDYAAFLEKEGIRDPKNNEPGNFVDTKGNVLGQHKGLIHYTIGQRRGLGVAAGEPVYVIGKDCERNTLMIGPDSALYHREFLACNFNWLSIQEPSEPFRAAVRTRYHQQEADGMVYPLSDGQVRIVFDKAQRAITPGQAAVLYQGELVLGGGTICTVSD